MIVGCVKASNLNFCLQLSPFSANISLKKSLIKDKAGYPLKPQFDVMTRELSDKVTELENIVDELKLRLADSVTECEKANETIRELELKLQIKQEKIESIETEFEVKDDDKDKHDSDKKG